MKWLALCFASLAFATSAAAQWEEEFEWQEAVTTPTGDIYLFDSSGAKQTTYLDQPIWQANILVRNYSGDPELDELFGVYYIHCERHAWRHIMAVGQRRDGSGMKIMGTMPVGQFRTAPPESPMRVVIDAVCSEAAPETSEPQAQSVIELGPTSTEDEL